MFELIIWEEKNIFLLHINAMYVLDDDDKVTP